MESYPCCAIYTGKLLPSRIAIRARPSACLNRGVGDRDLFADRSEKCSKLEFSYYCNGGRVRIQVVNQFIGFVMFENTARAITPGPEIQLGSSADELAHTRFKYSRPRPFPEPVCHRPTVRG